MLFGVNGHCNVERPEYLLITVNLLVPDAIVIHRVPQFDL